MTAQDYYVISTLAQQRMAEQMAAVRRSGRPAPAHTQAWPAQVSARLSLLAGLGVVMAAALAIWG